MNSATFSASAPAPTSTSPPIAGDCSTSGGPRPCWPSCKPHDGTSPHVREHRLCLLARALTEPIELLAARTTTEPAIALGGALGSLGHGFRPAFYTPHPRPPLFVRGGPIP